MKNTLLMFALLVAVVGLTGCSTTAPAPSDDIVVPDTENMDDTDMDMNDDEDRTMDPEEIDADIEDMGEDDDMMGDDVEDMEANVVIEITGENFSYSQDTIEVTQGDVVTINFTSAQGFHDWVLDEFDAATAQVEAGGTTSVTFVADQAGEFEYYCSVGAHRANGMVGTLIVAAAE